MSKQLLVRYLRLAVAEAKQARVPNQLIEPDSVNSKEEGSEVEHVDEFSGVGAIAGYTAPLGMSPDDLGRKKGRSRRRK
jgi:hypothetical protein